MANIQNWLWPAIDDLEDAKKAAHLGAGCAFFVAVVTGIVTVLSVRGMKLFPGLDASGFLDAGLFLLIGIFIYRYSRIAAVAGLLLYVGEQIMMIKMNGFRFSLIPVFFTLHFIAGVRGTFDYHHLKKIEMKEVPLSAPPQIFPQAPAEVPKTKKKWALLAVVVLGAVAALLAYGYYYRHFRPLQFSGAPGSAQTQEVPSSGLAAPAAEAETQLVPGERSFKMKDGKTITGRVLMEDDVYYTVETSGGRQEIVIKEDLA